MLPGFLRSWIRRKHSGSSLAGVVFFELCRIFGCRVPLTLLYRPIVRGLENIPETGPLLVVANHQSYFDPPFIGCHVNRRQLDFIARGGLFTNKLFGTLIRTLHSIPVAEDAPDTAAIKAALRRLENNGAVLIFPEGARTFDGSLQEFKRGAELLFRKAKCPVIPVAIEGVYDTWPRGSKPKLGTRLALSYGVPIPAEELLDKSAAQAPLDRLKDWIETERLSLREQMRAETNGAFPPPGPADRRFDAAEPA